MPIPLPRLTQLAQSITTTFTLEQLRGIAGDLPGVPPPAFPETEWQDSLPTWLAALHQSNRLSAVVDALRSCAPAAPGLQEIASWQGIAPRLFLSLGEAPLRESRLYANNLQRMIEAFHSPLEELTWREEVAHLERRVCQIEWNEEMLGTGFLVGPDLLLTCYHILEELFSGAAADGFKFWFDQKTDRKGDSVHPGVACTLAENGIIDFSPYGMDEWNQPDSAPPQADQLDYVLLRLASPPQAAANACPSTPRGWYALSMAHHPPQPGQALLIGGFPDGAPLRLIADDNACGALNENKTRLRYKAYTQPGSSGSPVFDSQWRLVAMHSGAQAGNEFHQGIPMTDIASQLKARGWL